MNISAFELPEDCDTRSLQLYKYWLGKKRTRICPSRTDIDQLDIPRLFPNMTLINVSPVPPRFTFRLVGTQVVWMFKDDPTGQEVGFGLKRSERDEVISRHEFVADNCCPLFQRRRLQREKNDFTMVERLMLPLSANGKDVDMLMVSVLQLAADQGELRLARTGRR
jgi:hypothetical protein